MNRAPFRTLAALAVVGAAAAAPAAEVAVLKTAEVATWRVALDAIRRATPSHNLNEYDLRNDRAEAERVLVGLKGRTAVIVALGPLAAQAARELAPEIPMVFCMVQDPAKVGLVPGPNVTGVAFMIPVKNQLAAFRMVYPKGVKVGVVHNPENTGRLVQEAVRAATVVRLNVVERAVTSDREIPEALRSLLRETPPVDALWIPPDPVLLGDDTRRFILSEMLKAQRPVYTSLSALVAEGALVANGPDHTSIGEQVGELVNRLAGSERGARIELLIPRAELIINKKIADKMKIEIPADALRAATKIF